LIGKEPNKMRLGLCSRSGDILEPMITPQWYVNCDSMARRATDAVRNGELKIIPAEHEKTWFQWLDNIRDWCVSRQLWWGHQIPAWFATKKSETGVSKNDMENNDRWVVARNEAVSCSLALATCSGRHSLCLTEFILFFSFCTGGPREGSQILGMLT
jgi:valyl-tRNA synthetase